MTAKYQRSALRGWIKWTPVLAIPFSILFFHAWLNIQILRADYTLRELDADARRLNDKLNDTGIAQIIHEGPEVLAAHAGTLNFVPPQPGQREVIYYESTEFAAQPEDVAFDVALRDVVEPPDPMANESLVGRSAAPSASAPGPSPVPVVPLPLESAAEPPVESAVPVTPQVPDGVVFSSEVVSTPVVLEIEESAEGSPEAAVVLELPDDAYLDPFTSPVDAGMGTLESL